MTARKLLRNLIKEYVLSEAPVTFERAATQNLSLAIVERGISTDFILYDFNKFEKALEASSLNASSQTSAQQVVKAIGSDWVVGSIAIRIINNRDMWGAAEVTGAAAEKGYGPMLYDYAMAWAGGLTSDRNSVTASAQKIWQQYKTSRPDVEHKLIDDINNPKTPTKEDDGIVHRGGEDNPLNYAYFINDIDAEHAATMLSRHIDNVAKYPHLLSDNVLFIAAATHFESKYVH